MALCFWRHSIPDYESDAEDPVLSEWGNKEALRAAQEIKTRAGNRKLTLLTSPLARCRQTLEQLVKLSGQPYKENAALRLKDSWESSTHFLERLDHLLVDLKAVKETECWVLCSHSDVLGYYLNAFGGPRLEIDKANFFWVSEGRVTEVNPL